MAPGLEEDKINGALEMYFIVGHSAAWVAKKLKVSTTTVLVYVRKWKKILREIIELHHADLPPDEIAFRVQPCGFQYWSLSKLPPYSKRKVRSKRDCTGLMSLLLLTRNLEFH